MHIQGGMQTSKYSIVIWDKVEDIDRPAWESVRDPDDLFMDPRMLRATADSLAESDSFSFVLVRDPDGRPVAVTCLWRCTVEGTLLAQEHWMIRAVKHAAQFLATVNVHRVLICGMPISVGRSNLRFAPGADKSQILQILNDKLEAIARAERLRCVIFKEFEAHELDFSDALQELGYKRAHSLPMNQSNPSSKSLSEHLAKVNSKRRSQINASRRKLNSGAVRLVVTSDPDEVAELYTDEVHRLYHAVLGKTETRLETLSAEFFRNLSRTFPENTTYCFILDGESVCAFGVVFCSGRVAYPLYVGVDYELNQEYDLYFNAMYAMLDASLRRGVELISWGQTADQFKKLKLDCYQTPRYFYLKGTNWLMSAVINFLFSRLFPARDIPVPAEETSTVRRAA
ncbi:MAG: GNAT family N-acetyltransferase [Planctomycetes bacterium]|nr:GNAT family N-acetyltransferase [Planctomycetota bacterium]